MRPIKLLFRQASDLWLRVTDTKGYWQRRAKRLLAGFNCWVVDVDAKLLYRNSTTYVCYAYAPFIAAADTPVRKVPFAGSRVTALRRAVRFAEANNKTLFKKNTK